MNYMICGLYLKKAIKNIITKEPDKNREARLYLTPASPGLCILYRSPGGF